MSREVRWFVLSHLRRIRISDGLPRPRLCHHPPPSQPAAEAGTYYNHECCWLLVGRQSALCPRTRTCEGSRTAKAASRDMEERSAWLAGYGDGGLWFPDRYYDNEMWKAKEEVTRLDCGRMGLQRVFVTFQWQSTWNGLVCNGWTKAVCGEPEAELHGTTQHTCHESPTVELIWCSSD